MEVVNETNEEEQENPRGISDADLRKSSNEGLIMIALAVLLKANQIEDNVLIEELTERAWDEAFIEEIKTDF